MIEGLKIAGCASYSAEGQYLTELRKINFIYGANGSGKTSISRVIAAPADHPACAIRWANQRPLECLVYNADFVERNFRSSQHPGQVAALRGITARLGSAHESLVDEALANWPAELSEPVIAGSQHKDGFWFEGSDDAVWNRIEEAFIGRPFGDLGPERRIEWRALGIRWIATFQNRYDETSIAEEFVAQLQIARAAFADTDLLLVDDRSDGIEPNR